MSLYFSFKPSCMSFNFIKINKRRLFGGVAILIGSALLLSISDSKREGGSKLSVTDLAKVTSANAECVASPNPCMGDGTYCTVYINGTPFLSPVCKPWPWTLQ